MAEISYPPNMPLHEDLVQHRRVGEERWMSPLTFMPLLVLATLLFLAGLWGLVTVSEGHPFANLSPLVATLVASLLPPIILLGVMLVLPTFSSPVWPYQIAMFQEPSERRLRWNLAVVATAHVYYGHVAQTEWLSLMGWMSPEERFRALGYITRVRSRLQMIPVITARDIYAMIICGFLLFGISIGVFHYYMLYAILHSIALLVALQLLMLYMLLMRWQHIRRLVELEEIFEELLPEPPPPAEPVQREDEVDQWYRQKLEEAWPEGDEKKGSGVLPPAPWE